MTFASKNLNPNETVALDMHPHWWYFAKPAATVLVAVVVGIVLLVKGPDGGVIDSVVTVVAIAGIVASAVWLLSRYMRWFTTHFVITSHRIIFRTGVLSKNGIEIPLERVNNVNFSQSIFERMLGAGDLLIESGGEDGQSRYTDIRHPDRVQRLIHAQRDVAAQRYAGFSSGPGSASAPAVDVTEQLERLEGMLQRGTLSPDEFEAQKRRLLGD